VKTLQLEAQWRRIAATTNSQTIHCLRPKSVRNFLTTYNRALGRGRAGLEEILSFAGDEDFVASGRLIIVEKRRYLQATVE
jgi:hypothetical protein